MFSSKRQGAAAWVVVVLSAASARATDFAVSTGAFVDGSSWVGGSPPILIDDANINNNGTAKLSDGDAIDIGRLHLGVSAGQKGTLVMNGGTLNVTLNGGDSGDQAVTIGDFGTGTFTMNGGLIQVGALVGEDGDFHIGKNGTGSSMVMNGGLIQMGGTLRVARGQSFNASATFSLLGGEFDTGAGVVVARGNGTSPTGTFIIGGTGIYIAGNSRGDGNLAGYSGEGFFSIANTIGTTGHVTLQDNGLVKARRLTGRQGTGDLTIKGDAKFFVVNDLGPNLTGALYGSYLGGGSSSNGDGSDGSTGNYTLTLRDHGLLDIDANAELRDQTRPELQGFQLARGNSKATATIGDNATFIVHQRLIIGGLGANANLNGFDGQAAGGTNPGGTATVTVTGGTLSADQLIVGGSGTGTLNVSGGNVGTKAYAATYDPTLGSGTSVDSIRIGMLKGSTGVMNVSGTAAISTGADLGIGQYGNGTLKVTGGTASIQAGDVYVQKFDGSSGKVIAEITGATHTAIKASNNVTINGGTFQVTPTAVPAGGAHTWDILVADSDQDGNGALSGKFTTVTLPGGADAIGRHWSSFYSSKKFTIGLTILGDANFDGAVGFPDLVAVAQHYGNAGQWPDGDFNNDGMVGFPDLVTVAQGYGSALPSAPIPGASAMFEADLARAASSVPEPSCISVIAAGVLSVLGRRRRVR